MHMIRYTEHWWAHVERFIWWVRCNRTKAIFREMNEYKEIDKRWSACNSLVLLDWRTAKDSCCSIQLRARYDSIAHTYTHLHVNFSWFLNYFLHKYCSEGIEFSRIGTISIWYLVEQPKAKPKKKRIFHILVKCWAGQFGGLLHFQESFVRDRCVWSASQNVHPKMLAIQSEREMTIWKLCIILIRSKSTGKPDHDYPAFRLLKNQRRFEQRGAAEMTIKEPNEIWSKRQCATAYEMITQTHTQTYACN